MRWLFLVVALASCGRVGFSADESLVEDAPPRVDADAAPLACPQGQGAAMSLVQGVCIDNTETTRAQYKEFLAAAVPVDTSDRCSFKTTNEVLPRIWDVQSDAQALSGADWCDARDYCAWRGKRLCGSIGGGAVAFEGPGRPLPLTAEWAAVCSDGGRNEYPYGNTYVVGSCTFGGSNAEGNQSPPSETRTCAVPGTDVVDLVGNLAEWIDSCEAGTTPEDDRCRVPGAPWYFVPNDFVTCRYTDPDTMSTLRRGFANKAMGIRCCADPS